MSGDDQIAMKREISAQLNKLRREQRERLERQARRRLLAVGLLLALLVALLAALGFALFTERRSRQDSGAAERFSCRSLQYAQENAGRPALEPVAMAPSGSGHPGGAASYAWTPGWWAETHTLAQGGSTPPRATMVTG